MVNRKTNDPLNYLGVRAPTPPNMVVIDRLPITTDTSGADGPFLLGDFWLQPSLPELYVLANSNGGVADWRAIGL
ncbi:MAG TPA: hypothetical protein ENI23_15080 [bacterium]|nr:hypothetical protein [bacterium]